MRSEDEQTASVVKGIGLEGANWNSCKILVKAICVTADEKANCSDVITWGGGKVSVGVGEGGSDGGQLTQTNVTNANGVIT